LLQDNGVTRTVSDDEDKVEIAVSYFLHRIDEIRIDNSLKFWSLTDVVSNGVGR
jgi:hypothetical protein